ncbi:PP0621 family protein [Pollutimonas thiosulfatoxidans]|uniref:PP0621 family protein n=1 Tax=Pollutimonas thiosulfatoxidans TaxID=2028345 RepID=UPI0013E40D11|nr:PP0621 family protein [Pollutimonas thiosulfatoxidans]
MGKILFWIVLIMGLLLAARLLAHYNHSRNIADGNKDPKKVKNKAGTKPMESMVRCEHCGIHLPRSEAVLTDGRTWCSQEHARLGHNQ